MRVRPTGNSSAESVIAGAQALIAYMATPSHGPDVVGSRIEAVVHAAPGAATGLSSGSFDLEAVLPWLAVFGAWVFFGSFAVPMKWPSVVVAEVDPFVFQWYKTFWTFVASFSVLIFWDFEFTWWGLLSGFLWVPAGVASVVAVKHIGIACGQPIWQATIILTSFFWGFAILNTERVRSAWGTAASLICLLVGVLGMTFSFNLTDGPPPIEASLSSCSLVDRARSRSGNFTRNLSGISVSGGPVGESGDRSASRSGISNTHSIRSGERSLVEIFSTPGMLGKASKSSVAIGVGAALFNGLWGGANLVPSHLSPYKGVHYTISFGIGALIANLALLVGYGIFLRIVFNERLPSFQFRVMAVPGFVSGILWCCGNFCALYAVSTLGQGIGYSLVQCNGIVSGLWGILYYKELRGKPVYFWCVACCFCCAGILGLAQQRR